MKIIDDETKALIQGRDVAPPPTIDVARASASMVPPPGMISAIRERIEAERGREAAREMARAEVETQEPLVPPRPDFGSTLVGGSAHEERLQDAWDAKWAPDLRTARATIERLIRERAADRAAFERQIAQRDGDVAHHRAEAERLSARVRELEESVAILDAIDRVFLYEQRGGRRADDERADAQGGGAS